MAAFGIVLLVVLGLAAIAVVLHVVFRAGRDHGQRGPTAAEIVRARRHADVVAFREAELEELRTMGPVVDREILEGA